MFLKLKLWGYGLQSPVKGGMRAKGICKQDLEVNILIQEEREWEMKKASQ
jgi:hypothetical protein